MRGCLAQGTVEILQFYFFKINECSLVCKGYKRQKSVSGMCFSNVSVALEVETKSLPKLKCMVFCFRPLSLLKLYKHKSFYR